MFVDVFKTSRKWGPVSAPWNENAAVDSLGWPTQDSAIVLMSGQKNTAGTYKLSFECANEAVVVSPVACSFTLANRTYSNGIVSADLIFSETQLMMSFTNTNGGVRNVKLLRPGYSVSDTFTSEFLNLIQPFSTLRYMDFLATNGQEALSVAPYYNATPIEWSDRRLPNHASQAATFGRTAGGAYEYIIELSNLTGKDAWINVPYGASQDYIQKLAALFKANLNPGINLYVELSNEVWNWQFAQAQFNNALAGQDPEANSYFLKYAKQSSMVASIFRDVFGQAAMNNKVRVVMAWQTATTSQVQSMLKLIKAKYGNANDLIYAVAVAPYFTEPLAENCTSIKAIQDEFIKNSDKSVAWKKEMMKMMMPFNLKGGLVAYEGGPHHQGQVNTNLDIRLAAHRDAGMTDILIRDLKNNWMDLGAGLFCYFTVSGGYSIYGAWGLTEDPTDLNTPKYNAIKALYNNYNDVVLPPIPRPDPSGVENNSFESKFSNGMEYWGNWRDLCYVVNPELQNLGFSAKEGQNVLLIPGGQISDTMSSQEYELVDGGTYVLTYYVRGGTTSNGSTSIVYLAKGQWGEDSPSYLTSNTSELQPDGWFKVEKTYTNVPSTKKYLAIRGNGNNLVIYLDNISVKRTDVVITPTPTSTPTPTPTQTPTVTPTPTPTSIDGTGVIYHVSSTLDANEVGPVNGKFSFGSECTHPMYDGWNLYNYQISGTAVNGVDYELIQSKIYITLGVGGPPDQLKHDYPKDELLIVPKPNHLADGNKTVTVTIIDNKGGTESATLTIFDGGVLNTPTPTPTSTPTPTPIPVTSVSISKTSATIKVPLTLQLSAGVSPANASNKGVKWTSSNTKVATVSSAGKVTAKGPGTTTITVKTVSGTFAKTCKVTVIQPVVSIKLNKTSLSILKGKSAKLIPTINPNNASNKKVTWKSSNKAIATVSPSGIVKAIKKGSCYVSVVTVDGKKSAVCKVYIK